MRCIALIPIYKPRFDADEERNIRVSLENLKSQDCVVSWLAPNRIEKSYYDSTYPGVSWSFHDDRYFRSIQDYSRLLLSDAFYERYFDYEFMLILQPDAIVLKPTLNEWLDKPYDYVGAPWPPHIQMPHSSTSRGWEYDLPIRLGNSLINVPCRAYVGNGGLSLRRSRKIVNLLQEFTEAKEFWMSRGNPEDLLISMLATLSKSAITPTLGVAARFSIETDPGFFLKLMRSDRPFGIHGKSTIEYFNSDYAGGRDHCLNQSS